MMRLMSDSIGILVSQAPFLLVIALLVYLPANIATSYYLAETATGEELEILAAEMRLSGLVETLVGTLASAFATLTAARSRMGQPIDFGGTMLGALKLWVPFIGASILFNIGFTVGLFLLVVPGIYLALRWALVFPVIALENQGVIDSFKRSSVLIQGRKLEILGAGMIFFVAFAVLGFACYTLLELYLPIAWYAPASIGVDTFISFVGLFWPILMTLYYLEARAQEQGDYPGDDPAPYEEEAVYEVVSDDDNPYRSPSV